MGTSGEAVSGLGADRAYRYRVRRGVAAWFDQFAATRRQWRARNSYYHDEVSRLARQVIPPGARVLLLGCATGDLPASLRPSFGVGVDVSGAMVREANERWGRPGAVPGSTLAFIQGDAQELPLQATFDYIVCSDLLGYLEDIQATLSGLHAVSHRRTMIVVTSWNWAWQPLLRVAEAVGLKMPDPGQNWLGRNDIENLFALADLEVRSREAALLSPVDLPVVGPLINRVLVNLPALQHL